MLLDRSEHNFNTTVNGEEQSISPTLSRNYTYYSLNIIDLDSSDPLLVNDIITTKKYVLTKG